MIWWRPVGERNPGPGPFEQRLGDEETQSHALVLVRRRALLGEAVPLSGGDEGIAEPVDDGLRKARPVVPDRDHNLLRGPSRLDDDLPFGEIGRILDDVAETVGDGGIA